MLKQRVITALIMAGLFFSAVAYLSLPALALLFGALIAAGGWEWSRLAGWVSRVARVAFVALLVSLLVALYYYCQLGAQPSREQVQPFLGLACLWWSFALLWVKSYPSSAGLWNHRIMRSFIGLLILVPGWFASVYLLSFPRGALLVVMLVIIVVAADVGAYFTGKAFGKHKLAPSVSPAKTWEGFWGGELCAVLVALSIWYFLPPENGHIGIISVLAVVLTTSMTSVLGDLAVSMVKRESGTKDSGNLLPGHGGVLDRLDSLCGAAPVFALGLLLAGW